MEENKSFWQHLFDFSFSELVTVIMVRILYIIGVIFSAFGTLYMIVSMFQASFLAGLFTLILSPLIFLIYVIILRVYLEILVVIFTIANQQKEMNGKLDELLMILKQKQQN